MGTGSIGSGLLVVVSFVKPVLCLQLLHQQHLLKLLCPFVRDVLRRLDGAHHREPVGSFLQRPLLRGRIGLLRLALLKLLGRLPEPPRLCEFAILFGKLPAKALRLRFATLPPGGGGYIALLFLLFFLPIIAAGISFIAIGFLNFIAIGFFDFAIKLLATVFGVRNIGHLFPLEAARRNGDSASGPAP